MGIANLTKKRLDEERIKAAVREYGKAKDVHDSAKRRLDTAKEELLNISAEYGLDEIETNDGTVLIKEQPGRRTWDGKRLSEFFADNPEQLDEFYRPGNPFTRITWKAKLLTD